MESQQREDRDLFSSKRPVTGDTLQPLQLSSQSCGHPRVGGYRGLAGKSPLAFAHISSQLRCAVSFKGRVSFCKLILRKMCLQLPVTSHISKTYHGREVCCQQSWEAAQEPNATQDAVSNQLLPAPSHW